MPTAGYSSRVLAAHDGARDFAPTAERRFGVIKTVVSVH